MLGVLITFIFASGILCLGFRFLAKIRTDLAPAEAVGLIGLVGLGFCGFVVLLLGLLPGGLNIAVYGVGALSLLGFIVGAKSFKGQRFVWPVSWPLAVFGFLILAALFALAGVLGPSDMNDWDSIAYHLAVPKIWLSHGQIDYIPYIHHSNFPGAIDNLFILGLKWGGESGAKAFSLVLFILGILALFGLTRRRYGPVAACFAALAFVGIPAAIWESGTAYIDVGHGLFAGLGILYSAEYFEDRANRGAAVRAAICLAFACASKYTGLQTLFACVALVFFAKSEAGPAQEPRRTEPLRHHLPALSLFVLLPLLIAGPWFIRNVVNTGNPVYPFFYGVLDGRNWSEFNAKIYTEEQKTFGAGHQIADFGAAVLGLAYQPGRYTNPGPTSGNGMPTGALGVVVVCAWLAWLVSGRSKRFESGVLIVTGMSLLMWFVLSQQSRYLITLAVPAAVLAGGALNRVKAGPVLAGLTALQAVYALYVAKVFHLDPKLPVVVGRLSREEYLKEAVPFYEAAQVINELVPKDGKIALYDEVFGYFLDVPYFWANPGHSTVIPYEKIENGAQLAEELKKLGFTHAYMNLSVGIAFANKEDRQRWLRAAGLDLDHEPQPYSSEERAAAFEDLRNKWKVLVAEAIASGRFKPVLRPLRSGALFEVY